MNQAMQNAMNMVNELGLTDLIELQKQIGFRVQEVRRKEHEEAIAKIHAIAKSVGMPLNEVIKISPEKSSRAGRPIRYVHPSEVNLSWTGLGRMPNWLKDFIEKGRALTEFEVKAA